MARPKKVSDAALLAAVGRTIGRLGPDGLTIRAVAAEAGLSPAAILQRFGSRLRLLRAFAEGGIGRLDDAFAAREGDRLADALLRAFGATGAHAPRREEMANHVAMLAADLRDPHLRRATQAHFRRLRAGIVASVTAAVGRGELEGVGDAPALARTLEAACHGTLVVWAVSGGGSLEEALRAALAAALKPFLPAAPEAVGSQTPPRPRVRA
jgi:AcrR family transcriptional regulator